MAILVAEKVIELRGVTTRFGKNLIHDDISLAVERDLEISGDADLIVPAGHAIAIASHVRHRLGPPGALVRSFYLDPLFRAGTRLSAGSAPVLLTPIETAGLGDIASGADAKRWASDYLDRSQARPVDARPVPLAYTTPVFSGFRAAGMVRYRLEAVDGAAQASQDVTVNITCAQAMLAMYSGYQTCPDAAPRAVEPPALTRSRSSLPGLK